MHIIGLNFLKRIITRKMFFLLIPLLILAESTLYFAIKDRRVSRQLKDQTTNYEKFNKETLELRNAYVKIQEDFKNLKGEHDKLKNDYGALSADRDNLLVEVKKRFADSERLGELAAQLAQLKKEKDTADKEKLEVLNNDNNLKAKIKELQAVRDQLVKEREQLRVSLDEAKTQAGTRAVELENAKLSEDNKNLARQLKEAEAQIAKLKK